MDTLPLPSFTPVPRKTRRHDGWTVERQRGFIEALADYGSVRAAANAVGMTPESAYYLRRQAGAEEFAKAWAAALDHGVRRIEDVAMDRALNGVEVPVYSYGKLVGTRRIYNDRLLMFMLRNRAPERFAADGARGMNALDRQRLARMKKEWREEWEQEKTARNHAEEAEELENIDAMLDQMHQRELAAMSPRTRAAYEAWKAAQREDSVSGYRPWDDPEHPSFVDPSTVRPEPVEGPTSPPSGFFPEPEEPEDWDGLRRLKDESWRD